MKTQGTDISPKADKRGTAVGAAPRRGRHTLLKVLKWCGIVLLSLVLPVFAGIIVLSAYLTPRRLTELVNSEGSRYLNADIRAHNVSYTLWRTFPRFHIESDSITVVSRTLRGIPDSIRRQLPADADFLGALRSFSGSINVVDLFLNRYVIHDVRVDGLRVNLVAYDDSINNYDIIPHTEESLKQVPYVSAHLVSLRNPGAISYFSKASDTRATLRLADLVLKREKRPGRRDIYKLSLGGKVTARSSGLTILHDFPFSLDGNLQLRFHPFGVLLSDYAVDLGELSSRLTMSVGMGDDPRIETFDYKIKPVNLMSLLGYIPGEYIPALQGLNADLQISLSARLLSSWSFTSESFPSIAVDFHVPQGDVSYTVSTSARPEGGRGGLRTYTLTHSPITGEFIFDGNAPDSSYVAIPRFTVEAPGLTASLEARMTHLTESPAISALVGIDADIASAMRYLPAPTGVKGAGHLESSTRFACRISDFSREAMERGLLDIRSSGEFNISGLSLSYPAKGIAVKAGNINAVMGERAASLTPKRLAGSSGEVTIDIDRLSIATGRGDVRAAGLSVTTRPADHKDLTPASLSRGLPLDIDVAARNLFYTSPKDTLALDISNLRLADIITSTSGRTLAGILSDGVRLDAGELRLHSKKSGVRVTKPSLSLQVSERYPHALDSLIASIGRGEMKMSSADIAGTSDMADRVDSADTADTAAARAIPPHSPELLRIPVPPAVERMLGDFKMASEVSFARCTVDAPRFSSANSISGLSLSMSEESIRLHGVEVNLGGTVTRLKGDVENLRRFVTEAPSADNPLIMALDVEVPEVNMNTLSHSYVQSRGGEEAVRQMPVSLPSDTVAILVPRNIKADVTARVASSQYTNLDLTDIVLKAEVDSGVADIRNLGIGTTFGRANASFTYDTSDIMHMSLAGNIDMKSIDIVKFFKKFNSLLEMMPQMKNLTGILSVKGSFGAGIYPTMYLDIPSAEADLTVGGRDLVVHQSPFIRKITKMMLIRTDADIHIPDIKLRAAVHDNLLQLYPFRLEFDRYKLRMLGVNNFNGRLYYHIAVEKSPVPFPFGINIEGMFRHPELRFGRARYNIKKGEEVTERIVNNDRMNLTGVMRKLMQAFVVTGSRYHQHPYE